MFRKASLPVSSITASKLVALDEESLELVTGGGIACADSNASMSNACGADTTGTATSDDDGGVNGDGDGDGDGDEPVRTAPQPASSRRHEDPRARDR